MNRTAAILLLMVGVVACSNEDAADPAEATAGAPAVTAEQPPEEAQPPVQDIDDEASVAIAQAMDESETAGDEEAGEQDAVILAEAPPATSGSDTAPEPFKQGKHYRLLTPVQPTGVAPGQVEVIEVFWYGCPHCYTLEPHVQAWLSDGIASNAVFGRIPAALNRGWQVHARVYYTAEALGVLNEAHAELFREINVDRNPLNSEEALIQFFSRFGVSEEDFLEAFNSFAIQTRLRQSDSMVRRYRITGVPAIVVNGKYVTGADMAGGIQQLFDVVDFLIAKESK